MIYDLISRGRQYEGIHPGILRGLRFLGQTNFDLLLDGRYELDGDSVFANVMTYETKPSNDTPETHEAYIDIQYLISGEELVLVAPVEEMTGLAEARPEGDIWFHHGTGDPLTLGRGRFLVLWPGDAHAPGIAVSGVPNTVRKCVVKVKV